MCKVDGNGPMMPSRTSCTYLASSDLSAPAAQRFSETSVSRPLLHTSNNAHGGEENLRKVSN